MPNSQNTSLNSILQFHNTRPVNGPDGIIEEEFLSDIDLRRRIREPANPFAGRPSSAPPPSESESERLIKDSESRFGDLESDNIDPILDGDQLRTKESFVDFDAIDPISFRDPDIFENLSILEKEVASLEQIATNFETASRRYSEFRFRLEEFVRLDRLHQDEVQAGLHSKQYKESVSRLKSAQLDMDIINNQNVFVNSVFRRYADLEVADPTPTFEPNEVGEDAYLRGMYEISKGNSSPSDKGLVEDLLKANYVLESVVWQARRIDIDGQKKLKEIDIDQIKEQVQFEAALMFSRRRRALTSRAVAISELELSKKDGSPLNYQQQINVFGRMFGELASQCMSRAGAVREAAQLVYGIEHPDPTAFRKDIATEMTAWVRTFIQSIDAIRRVSKIEAVAISVKDVTGFDGDFVQLRRPISFRLDESFFGRFDRIQGLALYVKSRSGAPVFNVRITPPPLEAKLTNRAREVDYSGNIPIVLDLSTIHTITPDVSVNAVNWRALGTWIIDGTSAATRDDIEDLVLALWARRK